MCITIPTYPPHTPLAVVTPWFPAYTWQRTYPGAPWQLALPPPPTHTDDAPTTTTTTHTTTPHAIAQVDPLRGLVAMGLVKRLSRVLTDPHAGPMRPPALRVLRWCVEGDPLAIQDVLSCGGLLQALWSVGLQGGPASRVDMVCVLRMVCASGEHGVRAATRGGLLPAAVTIITPAVHDTHVLHTNVPVEVHAGVLGAMVAVVSSDKEGALPFLHVWYPVLAAALTRPPEEQGGGGGVRTNTTQGGAKQGGGVVHRQCVLGSVAYEIVRRVVMSTGRCGVWCVGGVCVYVVCMYLFTIMCVYMCTYV